jgi:hypothetical protein
MNYSHKFNIFIDKFFKTKIENIIVPVENTSLQNQSNVNQNTNVNIANEYRVAYKKLWIDQIANYSPLR